VYLKQIELENFKSFGGKLTIPLLEGYTAITGPNGSGKSNITDAILFVLGPKSSKAIRAGRLTDLIFDGGKTKNRSDFTRVSLVFDNTDRMIPWDSDTVRLTRHVRVSRTNSEDYSSYFYINDRKSSMSEFDSLLTKARISAEGYNMVQQGDVTNIVQIGNLERRRIIDGISGIASYDQDIGKAKEEREEAVSNLERIGIIMNELRAQLEQLEKDREAARKYLAAQDQLDLAKAQLVHRQLETARAEAEHFREQIARHDEAMLSLRKRKEDLAAQIVRLEEEIRSKEAEIEGKVGPEYRELKESIDGVKIRLATMSDRIERARDERGEQESFLASFKESLGENGAALQTCINAIAETERSLASVQERLDAAKDENDRIGDEMKDRGGEHTILQNRLQELDSEIDEAEREEHEAQVKVSRAEASEDDASRSMASLDEQVQSADFEIKDAEWNYQQVKKEAGPAGGVAAISQRILEDKGREAELERQKEELDSAVRRLSNEYNALSAEKKAADRFNRGSAAVAAILELRDKGAMKGIHGTIQELATVDPGYETALAVAAGSKMQAVVVDNDDVAADGIAFLKKEKLGRVTFLPLSKMMGGKPRAKAIMVLKETLGYATDLMDYDQRYANAFWYVFGDTLVAESLADARRIMGGIRIVTKGGELLEASGAMVGGTISPQNIMKFGTASESQLDRVGSELRAANEALESVNLRLRDIREEIRTADNEMRAASVGSVEASSKLGRLEAQIRELRGNRERLSKELEAKRGRFEEASVELAATRSALAEASSRLEDLRTERRAVRDRINEIAPAGMQERMSKAREAVFEINNEVNELSRQMYDLKAERKGIEAQRESLERQAASVQKRMDADEADIKRYESSCREAQVELDALRLIEREMEKGIQGLRDDLDSVRGRKYQAESEKSNTADRIETLEGIKAGTQASLEISRAKVEGLEAEVLTVRAEVVAPLPSEEEIRRTIRSCESVITRMGNVNLRAIEDYDERKSRYDSLSGDCDKLRNQIKDLTDLTESLNSQKKGLFMKAYDAINTNFKEVYAQLSGGGEAFMKLEYEEDPFIGGLMINAKPKNGKLLRLEALSGGEKSLTALAFIFAIQEYQPSPFYVLDEVDMFLDSVNAEMVAARVKESSSSAQFIQVSLRKVTLAIAEHLIGVSRPPSGISKVIMQPDLTEVSKYESESLRKQNKVEDTGKG
jgi:chromosome segregation protein